MLNRRAFLYGAIVTAAAMPIGLGAQPTKISRLGYLSPTSSSDPGAPRRLGALRDGLRDLGYNEGQNIAIEARWGAGNYDRLGDLAAELVGLKVDVIVTYTPAAIQAARQATATIPIVMAGMIDPVAAGFADTLTRPGRNITGLSLMAPELVTKQLEIVKELAPRASRVGVLGNPTNAGNTPQVQHAQEAARVLHLELKLHQARAPGDIDGAFAALMREQAGAVVVLVDSMLVDHRARITGLAAKYRLPAVYGLADYAEVGGLMTYGSSSPDRFRRAATYVDKILKGAKPGDLPIEQPTKFELVINLKTARALGLTIPPSLLVRADQVIE